MSDVTAVTGTWKLTIKTPLGVQLVDLDLREEAGVLAGTARGDKESVELVDAAYDGERLTWSQSITKPLRLDLAFDLHVDGDRLRGTSKAGRLPRSKVTGERA